MSQFDYGHALWSVPLFPFCVPSEYVIPRETTPVTASKRIQPGDVGYVRRGRFHLLFSAGLPLGDRVPGSDVPQNFETLTVGKIVHDAPLPAGPLNTETVQVTGERLIPSRSPTPGTLSPLSPPCVHYVPFVVSSSSNLSSRMTGSTSSTLFQLKGGQGALLLTKYPTYREDVELEGDFKEYTRKYYNSWSAFAHRKGHGGVNDANPVLVTGIDRTRDFVMLCYSKDDDKSLNCEFTTPIPGVTDHGKWNKPGSVHTNHGPQLRRPPPTQTTGLTPSGDGNPETISHEYVFIRYFTVRKKRWFPKVIKASAGPHELGGGGHDSDGSPSEVLCASDQGPEPNTPPILSDGDGCPATSIDTEYNIVTHNIRAVRYFPRSPLINPDRSPRTEEMILM